MKVRDREEEKVGKFKKKKRKKEKRREEKRRKKIDRIEQKDTGIHK